MASDDDHSKSDPEDTSRRDFIVKITWAVGGAGAAAAAWPFIASMNPTPAVIARGSAEVSLDGIATGEMKTISWRGKPVFVLHRTPEQIEAMGASRGSDIDPEADSQRVKEPQWLVLIGLCTHLGCVPDRRQDGWFCPCHGSVFDNSGRVVKGPAPRNLDLPPYKFVAADKLVIGEA